MEGIDWGRGFEEGEQLENQRGNRLIVWPGILQQVAARVTFSNSWDEAEVCPFSGFCNSTSERLIIELIRADPLR